MKEDEFFINRINELANKAYFSNIITYTDFLNPIVISNFLNSKISIKCNYLITGGVQNCERKIIIFSNEDDLVKYSPINCVRISPKDYKFADNLTHRDFLGALMNIGIERDTFGDIFVKNNEGYVLCLDKVSDYIKSNLSFVKRTRIECEILDDIPTFLGYNLKEYQVSSASNRIDAIISAVYNISRNKSKELFDEKFVFVNDKLCLNSSYFLKDTESVSVRGYGKFIFIEMVGATKKGNFMYKIKKFQ